MRLLVDPGKVKLIESLALPAAHAASIDWLEVCVIAQGFVFAAALSASQQAATTDESVQPADMEQVQIMGVNGLVQPGLESHRQPSVFPGKNITTLWTPRHLMTSIRTETVETCK